MQRKITRQIHIGAIAIGGGAPVSVQSMTNTKTQDAQATVRQIEALAAAGCDIVRLAVPDKETYRIQELHLPIYHALCIAAEEEFFGTNDK